MSEPPAEILRRLRPIPTYRGAPSTRPGDVIGVGLDGRPSTVPVVEATEPVVLLFLSADCLGCRDLWAALSDLGARLGPLARLAVVTKDPADEDVAAVAALAGDAPDAGVPLVMSTRAFTHYRAAAPFFVVATADRVQTEGVAWGVEETVRAVTDALGTR